MLNKVYTDTTIIKIEEREKNSRTFQFISISMSSLYLGSIALQKKIIKIAVTVLNSAVNHQTDTFVTRNSDTIINIM